MSLRHSVGVGIFALLAIGIRPAAGLEPVVVPSVALELHRFASPDSNDKGSQILFNRNYQVAAAVEVVGQDDYLVYYGPGSSVIQAVIPNHELFREFDFSNWGVAVKTTSANPEAMYTAPYGGALTEVFRNTVLGSHSRPAINDSGAVAFTSRVINHHGNRDVWRWRPGETTQLLPELGEDALGEQTIIDNAERISAVHEFPTPTFVSDLYRYDPVGGWQNLTPALSEYPSLQPFEARSRMSNAQGDILFGSEEAVFPNPDYYVNFFKASDSSIQRIADITRPHAGSTAAKLVLAAISDGGEAVFAIGATDLFDPNISVLFRTPDGTVTDLSPLLPAGESFGMFPFRPQIRMNHLGQMLLETRDTTTGLTSYFFYDYHTGTFLSPSSLADLSQPLYQPTLTDDGLVYYWVDEGPETALMVTAVPEPGTVWLALAAVVVVAGRAWRRRGIEG